MFPPHIRMYCAHQLITGSPRDADQICLLFRPLLRVLGTGGRLHRGSPTFTDSTRLRCLFSIHTNRPPQTTPVRSSQRW